MRSARVPCGLNSSCNSPARYCRSNSLFSPTYDEIILRICRVCSSNPKPTPSSPALLDTTVRSRTPDACKASIRFSGMPQAPKPPHIRVIPSLTTSLSAAAASGYTLECFLTIIDRSSLVAILVNLVRALFFDPDVARLRVREFRQLRAELGELQSRHFFVEMLRQHVHADGIFPG